MYIVTAERDDNGDVEYITIGKYITYAAAEYAAAEYIQTNLCWFGGEKIEPQLSKKKLFFHFWCSQGEYADEKVYIEEIDDK